jgi:hypothetical protein
MDVATLTEGLVKIHVRSQTYDSKEPHLEGPADPTYRHAGCRRALRAGDALWNRQDSLATLFNCGLPAILS